MNAGIKLVVYPARDLARAKTLYGKLLGIAPYADEACYVGFRVGDQELGLDPNGHKSGPVAYWQVSDIRKTVQSLLESGAQTQQEVKGVGGGKLVATLRDGDGNLIGLMQSP
jgi:predicted enzyme related to lactoylglutathione lyase